MSSNESLKKKCISSIEEMFLKYEDDEYTLNRIVSRITNNLPNEIENDIKKH